MTNGNDFFEILTNNCLQIKKFCCIISQNFQIFSDFAEGTRKMKKAFFDFSTLHFFLNLKVVDCIFPKNLTIEQCPQKQFEKLFFY